jgi:hypothetical protein
MRELGRLWDWLLPGLIGMSPMGAIAYYNARAENEAADDEVPPLRRLVPDARRRPATIRVIGS